MRDTSRCAWQTSGPPAGRVAQVNLFGWILIAAMAAAAVIDWVAVARSDRATERLAKPAYLVLLIALAWLLHADEVGHGRWLLVGLVLCLVGDVMLLGSSERRFRLGLVAFLIAHLAYLLALFQMPHASPLWLGVVLVALVLAAVLAVGLVPLARRDPLVGGPPTAYAVVLGFLAGYAWFTGNLLLAVGASLFVLSDALIGHTRFVRDFRHSHVVVMVTYHLAQLLIVLGVLRPDLLGRV